MLKTTILNKWLFTRIDNSALVVFRVLFGLLIAIEGFSGIFSGWVKRTLIEPKETFTFIGFEFLQPLPGDGMYYYYAVLGILGLLIMLGYKYRIAIVSFTIMWSAVYLMQKTSYNNHYYLLMLLCIMFTFFPANANASLDAKFNPKIKRDSMPRWVWLAIVFQMWIVYTYASVAKIYPDWFNGTFPELLMKTKHKYWLVGDFLQTPWVHTSITYFGFIFDLLIIPLLLWNRTRWGAFLAAVFFHLFNSFIFHIGIFPYLSLAFTIFFFPRKDINRWFLRNKKTYYDSHEINIPAYHSIITAVLIIWFAIQIGLPLRHWFIKDDVLWTEEGHRLSWRMMLRSKSTRSTFKIVEKGTTDTIIVDKAKYLTPKQQAAVSGKPDMVWQFAQRLKRDYAKEGKDIQFFADINISVNGRPYTPYIDTKTDLANEKWHYFKHSSWILPSQLD